MDGRCAVETWTQFGVCASSCSQKITFGSGPDVFICTGSEEVHVFSSEEKQLRAVLHFPAPVSDLVHAPDKQLLYVSCKTGVYCVSLPSLLSRTQSSPHEAASSSSSSSSSSGPAELKISSEFLVVGEEDVLSLLLVDSVLLLLSQRDACWLLTLYKTQSGSCERLRSFSLTPVAAAPRDGFRGRSALTCVHSADPTSLLTALPASHFRLESVLFKLLFGIDAALTKSSVVLCGLSDGRLCFLPLRLPGSRLRVLHSLEQPVVFLGASVVTETNPGWAQCLVAVGAQGRVVLMKANKGGPEGSGCTVGFVEGCVPGPVVCVSVDERCLYYSTGSDLLGLDLCEGSSEREESRQTAAALHSPTSFNVCRLAALTAPVRNIEGKVQLMGLSQRGQLQRIVLPEGSEDKGVSGLTSAQGRGSIRDLLSAIGDVCERVSVLKTTVKSKNQILRRLNQVLNISFLLLSNGNGQGCASTEERPIRCRAVTGWSRLLQRDSLILTCILENSSPYVLEGGWTLSVSVFPLSLSPRAGEESSSASFSFPFQNLHPGETLDVTLPLVEAAGGACLPVGVTCSLISSLSNLLGDKEEMMMTDFPDLQSCISLPLNTLTVDWLGALQQVNVATDHRPINKNAIRHSSNCATDAVRAFLISHRSVRRERGGGVELPAEREQYSARIRVSSEILRDTLVDTVDLRGPKSAPRNLCTALLDWLLSEAPGGGRVGQQGDKINGCVVHARGPNGEQVKLSAKEVKVAQESREEGEEGLSAIEVCLDSSSIAAVCGLHHAVLQRIQTLLKRAPESATSTKRLLGFELRQTLQRAEHLLQQIQQSRISGTSRGDASASLMSTSLLDVYQELRENPLLII